MRAGRDDAESTQLANCLETRKQTIVELWRQRVLDDPTIPKSNELAEPLLRDHIPAFVDAIIEALIQKQERDASEEQGKKVGEGAASRQHAKLRILVGYSLPEALQELSHLRVVICEACREFNSSVEAMNVAHIAIDRAMGEIAGEIADEIARLKLATEETLWQLRSQMQTMLEGVRNLAIFMADAEGFIVNWNPGVEQVLGYHEEEFVGKSINMLFTADDLKKGLPNTLTHKALTEGKATVERWHPRKDGTIFWAEDSEAAIRDEDGKVIGFTKVICDRSQQKEAEDSLRGAEARYRLLMENIRDHLLITLDKEGRITEWNLGAEKITGFTADEVIGKSASLFFTEEDRDADIPARELQRALADGRAEDIRWHRRKDGSRFWANGFTTALFDEKGSLAGFSKVARDDTARQMAVEKLAASEARLRDSQEHLELTQEAASVTSWDWDLRTDKLRWGSNAASIYGIDPPNDMTAFTTLIHPDDRDKLEQDARRAIADGTLVHAEFRTILPDGNVRWLLARGRPVFDEARRPLRILGVNMEITSRKRVETERDKFFEISGDLLAITSCDGIFRRVNPAWEPVLGYRPEELMDKRYLDFVHPDDRDATVEMVLTACSGTFVTGFENRYRHKNGSYHWLLWSTRFNPEEKLLFCNARDITDRKRTEAEVAQAKASAEEANQSKSTFLASMSHEIRTPLGAILGFAELLKVADLPPDKRSQFVDAIARNGRELGRLIDEILDLSKVEAGRIEIECLPISLPDLLDDVQTSLMPKAKEKGIELIVQRDIHMPTTIHSDPTRLRQILLNIAGNAVKFTNQGSVTMTVEVDGHQNGATDLAFVIEDTGIGLSDEARAKLFKPFTQADSSITRRYGGTGLGLVLAQQLARRLGGDVRLERSTPGQGSTFVVTIRSAPAQEDDARERSTPDAPSDSTQHMTLKDVRILVAEDSPDNQHIARLVLQTAGAAVDIVSNGAEAVEAAIKHPPDLILMDIAMPVMDGYDATRELRLKGFKRPIIALTAHAMQGEREKSLQAGCSDYLTKPFDQVKLVELIARILKQAAR